MDPEVILDIDLRMAGESDVQLAVGIGPVHLTVKYALLLLLSSSSQTFVFLPYRVSLM
jgi:hypothetical protein